MEFDYPCIITSPRASGDVIQMQLVPAINLHFFPFPGKAQSALLDAIIRYPFPWSRILTVEFLPLLASFFFSSLEMPSESSSSSRHSLAHVNQWLNKQRSKSAHVPWSRRKSELSKKVQCSSPPQAAEEDDDNEEERYYYAQPSAATRRTLSWQPAPAYSKDISIPTRGTSKTYKLDPELQARIDQVIASEQMQMLAQRVQQHRKSLHSVSLQPPPPVPQHRY